MASHEEYKHSSSSYGQSDPFYTFKQIRRKTKERNFQEIRKAYAESHLYLTSLEEHNLNKIHPMLLDVKVHWQNKVKMLEEVVLEAKREEEQILLLHYMSQLFHNLNTPKELVQATNCNIFIYHQLHSDLTQVDTVIQKQSQHHVLNLLVGLTTHQKFFQEFNLKNFTTRLFQLLDSTHTSVAISVKYMHHPQALWVLNHTLIKRREMISKARLMTKLNQFLARDIKMSKIPQQDFKIYMWTFYQVCHHNELDKKEPEVLEEIMVKGFITIKPLYLTLPSDFGLLQELVIVLYIFTQGEDSRSKLVIDMGILPQIFKCLSIPNRELKMHSLGALGNITGCNHSIACTVYHNDTFMEQLINEFLENNDEKLLRMMLWIFKNITCTGSYEVEMLLEAKVLDRVSQFLAFTEHGSGLQHMALVLVASALEKATDIVVKRILFELKAIELLIHVISLQKQATMVLKHALEALVIIAKRTKAFPLEEHHEIEMRFKNVGVVQIASKLTTHEADVVHNRASELLELLEDGEQEEEDADPKKIEI